MKKFIARRSVMALLFISIVAGGLGAAHTASALTASIDLFNPTTLLGISLTSGNSGAAKSEFALVDRTGNSDPYTYVLPSLDGRDGSLFFVKARGTSSYVLVEAASGEKVDYDYTYIMLPNPNSYVTLIADEGNNTWWVVGSDTQ